MQDYKTVKEKSDEWNLSSRHIQFLCREGAIEGAIKRAGSWFIPESTMSPAKNSKWNTEGFNFTGTKKEIFNSAIDLFMRYGFDNVSLRDIASKVGIQQSTIYNHFKSKNEILYAIYDFYCYYHIADRPTLDEMEHYIKTESLMDIINYIRYDFNEEYSQRMLDISKIMFQRIGIDERVKKITKSRIVDEGIKYVEDVFDLAISLGRFAPFNTHLIAVYINSIRIYTLYNWIVDPFSEYLESILKDEQALYELITEYVIDLNPPADSN